jgi:hypothetical protein
MDQRPDTPPPWLPASRPQPGPPAAPGPPTSDPPPKPPPPGPRFRWRRLLRSPRGAAGLGVLAAALLLWPFAGFSSIPWLVGVGALIVLRLLRLDGLLRGWDIPLAGCVVVVGLMMSTGPWAWALAGSIGVLLAGLAQLPWWRLAAVGAVLCVVSGTGYAISAVQSAELQRQIDDRAADQLRVQLGETRPARVLPALVDAVRTDDAGLCRLLAPQAEAQLLAAMNAPACPAAVTELHRRIGSVPEADAESLPPPQQALPQGWVVDGCNTGWGRAAGPGLGQVVIEQTDPSVQRFAVTGFRPC